MKIKTKQIDQVHWIAQNRTAFALCTALALSTGACFADDKSKGAPPEDRAATAGKGSQLQRADEKFIHEAHRSGQMEVQMGKLAVKNGESSEVKQFGQRLIDDHTKAGAELKQLAASLGVTLPSPEKIAGAGEETDRTQVRESEGEAKDNTTDKDHAKGKTHAEMKRLEGISGAEFDRAFARMAVDGHEKSIKLFEGASKDGDHTDVKAFAAKTLPTLREHLQQAKTLQAGTK